MTDARPTACRNRMGDEGKAIPPFGICSVPGCDPTRINGELCYSARPVVPPEPPQPPARPLVQVPAEQIEQLRADLIAACKRLFPMASDGKPFPYDGLGYTTLGLTQEVNRLVIKVESSNSELRNSVIDYYETTCRILDKTPNAISAEHTTYQILGWLMVDISFNMNVQRGADWTEPTESGKLHVPTLQHVLKVFDAVDGVTMPRSAMVAAIQSLLPKPPMTDDERAGFHMWACGFDDDRDGNEEIWYGMPDSLRKTWINRAKRYEAARNAE